MTKMNYLSSSQSVWRSADSTKRIYGSCLVFLRKGRVRIRELEARAKNVFRVSVVGAAYLRAVYVCVCLNFTNYI